MLTVLRHPTVSPFTSACRLATGRSAILHMAQRWNPDHVFMPCYVPEGVLAPFLNTRANIVFYKLQSNLHPNFDDLLTKMEANRGERPIIVSLQYFGFRTPFSSMTQLAHQYGGILFADCAHSVVTGDATGADVVLHSLNKFLPVADGAIMASRRDDLDLSIDEGALNELPHDIVGAYDKHLAANDMISRAITSSPGLPEIINLSEAAYETYYAFISNNMQPMRQSAISRAREAAADFTVMAASRWAKSVTLLDHLHAPLLVRDEAAQFAFPIRCHGKRDEMSDALNEIGVMPITCSARWDHIPIGFEFEAEFIDDHLLLPLNEDVSVEKLIEMTNALNRFA